MTPEATGTRVSTRSVQRGPGQPLPEEPTPVPDWSGRIGWTNLHARLAAHPVAVDVAIALAISAVILLFEAFDADETGSTLSVFDIVACAAASILIVLRRCAPLPILAISVAAGVWSMFPDDDQPMFRVAACLALYTVAATFNRRTAWTAGLLSAMALYVAAAVTDSTAGYRVENLEIVAWIAFATAAGDAVRSRRAYLIARQERAAMVREQAIREREDEARRQVVEERLRIARELHDVVAHRIAVINVQAGVAAHLLHDDPVRAEEALTHVRQGAKSVLDELSGILSVMRRSDDPEPTTEPLPTLDQIDRLIAEFARTGLEVEWHVSGARQPVPPSVSLAAYRIVQEALTNAHRHGSAPRAQLWIGYTPGALTIKVCNDAQDNPGSGGDGYGIVGMRERVAAAGGTIAVGRMKDGQFRVEVSLPLPEGDE